MSRKFKIVLHVGTEKTGTTTLQKVLFDNKRNLIKNGVCYFNAEDEINSRHVAAACIGDQVRDDYLDPLGISTPKSRQEFRKKIWSQLDETVASLPDNAHTLLISSEHFHSRLTEVGMIKYLKSWLTPYASSFEVVCYLRRQVDMVVSLYSTILKGGGVETFAGAINRMLKVENHYCNYDIFLSKWERVFSREEIRVKRFERSEMVGGSIVDDFLTDAGISPDCIVEKTQSTNESITHLGQALLREVNAYNKAASHAGEKEKKRIRRLIANSFSGKGRQLPPDEARKLQSQFDESNERVRARWFPEEPELFDGVFPEDERRDLSDDQERIISNVLTFISSGGEKLSDLSQYDEYIDVLKKASRVMEKRDLKSSLRLMELANGIRPGGPAIEKRLEELKSIV